MKKTIGTVRAIVFGNMLTAAVSCEGMMREEHVVSLIKTSDEDAMVSLWTDYLMPVQLATSGEVSFVIPCGVYWKTAVTCSHGKS
jgi:hypothetical protein